MADDVVERVLGHDGSGSVALGLVGLHEGGQVGAVVTVLVDVPARVGVPGSLSRLRRTTGERLLEPLALGHRHVLEQTGEGGLGGHVSLARRAGLDAGHLADDDAPVEVEPGLENLAFGTGGHEHRARHGGGHASSLPARDGYRSAPSNSSCNGALE